MLPSFSRTDHGPVSHEWTANADDADHHHGLLDLNEIPCYLALYWHSKARGRTTHVGTYRLNLRRLVAGAVAQAKPSRKVRVRFVRDAHGVIAIQAKDSAPALPVGTVSF
jgi:hypothetical protein